MSAINFIHVRVTVLREKVTGRIILMWAKNEPEKNERGWTSDTCRYTRPSLRRPTSPLVIVTANQILAPPSGAHPSARGIRNPENDRGIRIVPLSHDQWARS